MNLQEFERAVLKLAFETDARITTATVAYYLGVPSREANELLNQLLTDGLLELDSDDSGNLFYTVANQGDVEFDLEPAFKTDFVVGSESISSVTAQPTGQPHGVIAPNGPARQPGVVSTAPSGTDSSTAVVLSNQMVSPVSARPMETPRPHAPTHTQPYSGGSTAVVPTPQAVGGIDGSHGYGVAPSKTRSWSPLVISRDSATDGTVNPFMNTMIVSKDVTCEPKPFAQTAMIRCDDTPAKEDSWFGVAQTDHQSHAMIPLNDSAVMEYDLEQPEHQPGMALLLSLILCGTGQIYNGEVWKGVTMMAVCFLLWFVLLGWVVHIWSIVDAVVIAERLNRKQQV